MSQPPKCSDINSVVSEASVLQKDDEHREENIRNEQRLSKLVDRIDRVLCCLPNYLSIVPWLDIRKKISNGHYFIERDYSDFDEYLAISNNGVHTFCGIDWKLFTNDIEVFAGQNVGQVRIYL